MIQLSNLLTERKELSPSGFFCDKFFLDRNGKPVKYNSA